MAEFPTYEQMAKNVAEKALDEILYDGKSIREWMKIIAEQEPKTGHLSNKDWVDLLTEQFNVSRTSAKEMLHAMMSVKKEDNFKKQFSGGCNVFNNSKC